MALATLNLTLGSDSRKFHLRPGTSDEGVFVQALRNSEYNFSRLHHGAELLQLYDRIASSKAPLIVDAGANIGASPLYFALSFPKAWVVAIEPEHNNFELLSMNAEGLRIECIRGALASKFGSINLVDPGEGSWGFRASTVGAGKAMSQTVPCVTINDIYDQHARDCSPFVVKIDIEGGERELFSANTEWVAKTPLIIIELHDWLLRGQASSRPFLQCISGYDRDFVSIGEIIFSIDNSLLGGWQTAA